MPLLGLLSTLLILAVPVALVVWLVRVSRRGEPDEERAGWSLRRFLQYTFLLAALFTAAAGVARLVELALPAGERLAGRGAAELALGLSLSIVGLPAYVALWWLVRRPLQRDREERASLGWSLYLAVASTVSLIIAFVDLVRVGGWAVGVEEFQPQAVAGALVWGAVWALHTWLTHHPDWSPAGRGADLGVLAGSLVGLVGLVGAVGTLLALGFEQLYQAVAGAVLVETDAWEVARRSLVTGLLGGLLWWWHWLREAQRGSRTTLWHVYMMLFPILGGLLAAAVSGGAILQAVLQWLVGVPESPGEAAQFDLVPGALAAGLVGSWAWWYHRVVLGEVADRRRTEPERAYEYLVAAVGLVAAASGVTVAIVALVQALAPAPLVAADPEGRRSLVLAVTLLVVGAPLWWVFWRRLQDRVRLHGKRELSSPSRRAYLFLLFGVAGLTALVSLIVVLFVLFRDLFEGVLDAGVLHDLRTPIALLLTAGGVSAYHWAVYREDRKRRIEVEPVRHVLLVTSESPLGPWLAERIGARVRVLRRLDGGTGPVDREALVRAVLATPHRQALVVVDSDGGVQVVPYEAG
jgi:hypothetical protein